MTGPAFDVADDIPCGRAKQVERVASDHVRFFMPADEDYMAYWCVRARAGARGVYCIEVFPDPDYAGPALNGVPRSYAHRVGSGIVIRRAGRWSRVPADGQLHEQHGLSGCWLPDRLVLSLELGAGEEVVLSNTIPWPYKEAGQLVRAVAEQARDFAGLVNIGSSAEGRDIVGLDFRARDGLPAVLVVAGEHATEFAGQHAVRGIIEFLASDCPGAVRVRRRVRVLVAPQVNPDGNVRGLMKHNALGANLCESYSDADLADPRQPPECRAVFEWADAARPALVLNFHGGTWTFGNPPHHFTLRVRPELHPSPVGRARQEAVDRAIVDHTDGTSRVGRLQDSSGYGLHNHCAAERWSAAGLVYEPELGSGVAECMRTGVRVLRATADALLAREE